MIYYNNTFKGHWPVGTSAIVMAHTRSAAAAYLRIKLEDAGLGQEVPSLSMIPIGDLEEGTVIIVQDGDY